MENSWWNRALKVLPGGVDSPVRAFGGVGGVPLFIQRAQGPYLYADDGNAYVDFIGSWGPMILGHNPKEVVEALKEQLSRGLSFGMCTDIEVELAECILSKIPGMEKIRLVNSGTEATMSAIRVARGATGRHKIIKFRGCYHGHGDSFLIQAGSGALTHGTPSSRGVTPGVAQDTLVADYNHLEDVSALFDANPNEIAAVIVEPVAGNMGCVPPRAGFLEGLRELCTKNGAVLIFDEVMTGFRVSDGGAAKRFGVLPDMITLGKIVGGGMPLAAYAGKESLMRNVSPLGKVYQAGTLSGNPIATTAGIETLTILKESPELYVQMEEQAGTLADCIKETMGDAVCVNRIGSLMSVFFTGEKVTDYASATSSDVEKYADYFGYMLEHGIYLAPSQFEAMFVSAAHTKEDIARTCEAIRGYRNRKGNQSSR